MKKSKQYNIMKDKPFTNTEIPCVQTVVFCGLVLLWKK